MMSRQVLSFMTALLTRDGYEVETANGGEAAQQLLSEGSFGLMITDFMMSPMDGLELMKFCTESYPGMPTVMISGYCTVENAIDVLKAGAFDYLPKPVKVPDLRDVVERAFAFQDSLERKEERKVHLGLGSIVAESSAMREVCQTVQRLLPTRTHSLILGPPGSGKELIARTIHEKGVSSHGPFMRIDCANKDAKTLEGELFGVRTPDLAPTGAFRNAMGGTLYLSEIGSLPLALQERLARILTSDHASAGSQAGTSLQVQVCAGSHDPLESMAIKGNFCGTLYQRLRPFSMVLPPLRERTEDILGLARYSLGHRNSNPDAMCMDADVELIIENYAWPGNVAELMETLDEARKQAGDSIVKAEHLPQRITSQVNLENLKARRHSELAEYKGKMLKAFLRDKEKEYLEAVVESEESKEAAAEKLELDPDGLDRHISGDDTSS